MVVFIDANKYLQFLSAEGEELTSLGLLRKYLKREKIELLLPKVTQDEFIRNAPRVQATYVNTLKKLEISAPQFASVVRYNIRKKRIAGHIKKIKDELLMLEADYLKKSDRLINVDFQYLAKNSITPEVDDEIFQRARKRRLIGNPPGKGNSAFHIGDEIVWETILRDVTHDDVVIISNDGGWADRLVELKIVDSISDDTVHRTLKKTNLNLTSVGIG